MKVVIILGLLQQSRAGVSDSLSDMLTRNLITEKTAEIRDQILSNEVSLNTKFDEFTTKITELDVKVTGIMNVDERVVNVTAREEAVTSREALVDQYFDVVTREEAVTSREESMDQCDDVIVRETNVAAMETKFQGLEDKIIKEYLLPTYDKFPQACVPGNNIRLIPNSSLEDCAMKCHEQTTCKAFEFFSNYNGKKESTSRGAVWQNLAKSVYEAGDCQLNSASNHDKCNGREYNLDLYIKTPATINFKVLSKKHRDLIKTIENN